MKFANALIAATVAVVLCMTPALAAPTAERYSPSDRNNPNPPTCGELPPSYGGFFLGTTAQANKLEPKLGLQQPTLHFFTSTSYVHHATYVHHTMYVHHTKYTNAFPQFSCSSMGLQFHF
jgi:hypothetical protein